MEPDPRLEHFIDEQLRRLPSVTAPLTLLTRVMAAIATRAGLPWWRQAWWHWPRTVQAAVLVVALSAAALAISGNFVLGEGFSPYTQLISERITSGGFVSLLASLGLALIKAVEPFLVPTLLTALTLYLLCMAFATALVRVASKRS